jgi:hypothetical protein
LGLDRKFAQLTQGSGRDQRHTVGFVIHGENDNFSYLEEGDLRFGKFGRGSILAWKYAQDLSYSLSHLKFRPVPSLHFGISSGDKNPANPDLQTFDRLFPKGLYYGVIDDSGSSFGGSMRLMDCTLNLEFCYEAAWLLKRNTSEPCRILRLLGQLITTPQASCWARTTRPKPFCEKLLRREGRWRMYLEK